MSRRVLETSGKSSCWWRRDSRRWRRSRWQPGTAPSIWENRIGSAAIAVGKNADLVVVKGDPAARIADVENVGDRVQGWRRLRFPEVVGFRQGTLRGVLRVARLSRWSCSGVFFETLKLLAEQCMTSVTSGSVLRWIAILGLAANTFLLAACGGSGNSTTPPPPPPPPPQASNSPFWAQWGSTAQHSGAVNVAAQGLNKKLADIVYDPFVVQEQAEFGGDLVAHYQATLTDGNDFYMESKSGTYPSCNPAGDWQNGTACGPNAWDQLTWNVTRYTWENATPTLIWKFASDWKPEPNVTGGLGGWEPVFHSVLANGFLYVPGAAELYIRWTRIRACRRRRSILSRR